MTSTMHIYGLYDPRGGELRYIGACADVDSRVRHHLRSRNRPIYTNWIEGLVAAGLKPEARIIETVARSVWQERERHWIAVHRQLGAQLFNVRPGGEGGHGSPQRPRSESHRQSLSKALMGHPVAPETVQKFLATRAVRGSQYKGRPAQHCSECGEWTEDVCKGGTCQRCYDLQRRSTCRHGHEYPKEPLAQGTKRSCATCKASRRERTKARKREYMRNYVRLRKELAAA